VYDEGTVVPPKLKLKQRVFELQKLSFERCLEPSEACSGSAIRAHSIQNANVLDKLCRDGHVVMPRLKAQRSGGPDVVFESVGRHRATTFTGLCSKHDQAIFAPIDNCGIDLCSEEHLFLLAYRSVLRELHAVLTVAVKIQLAFQEKVDLGLVKGDVPTPEGMMAIEHITRAFDTYEHKREYDAAYSAREYGLIEHLHFFEHGWLPTLAVSSLFSLDDVIVGDDVARVALNVYACENGATAVFSYLNDHARCIRPILEPFRAASGAQRLRMLSARVLNSCENFVIAPGFWNGLDDSRKRAIRDFYVSSLLVDAEDSGREDLMLFSPARDRQSAS
jgi:hypothetical protein